MFSFILDELQLVSTHYTTNSYSVPSWLKILIFFL